MQAPSGGWVSGAAYSSATAAAAAATSVPSASGASSVPYTSTTGSGSAGYSYASTPSSTAAVKAAGNLAETDDDDLTGQVDYYKSKVRTYLVPTYPAYL